MKIFLIAIGVAAMLGGCSSSTYTQYPIGIGPGPNALKRTPCACVQLPNLAQTEQG